MGESAAAGLIMAVAQEMIKRNEMHLIKLMVPISIFGDHLLKLSNSLVKTAVMGSLAATSSDILIEYK